MGEKTVSVAGGSSVTIQLESIERMKQVNVQYLLQLQTRMAKVYGHLLSRVRDEDSLSYHKLYDILKQHLNEVNEDRAEPTSPLLLIIALVALQQRKAIVTSSAPTYDPEPATVTEDDEMSKEKEIDKLMDLISLSINKGTGYDNQRAVNVAGARENVAYHKEKMLLYKQEDAGVQLNAKPADWKDDTDDESNNQELEAHYMYMAQIQEHMTGNLKLLTNFVEKFLGTVKFGNDQIAPILGYGDLVQGTITIKWVNSVMRIWNLLFGSLNVISVI
ncbi:hypothetical protein Tco_1075898 [Tanacetum coccineum]